MANDDRLVLITASLSEQAAEHLRAIVPNMRVEVYRTYPAGPDVPKVVPDELWRQTEVLYTLSTLPTPEQAPNLRWVQLHSAGADHIAESALYHSPVIVTTSSGVHAVPIAEYVFATVLAWFHHVPRMLEWQHRSQWPPRHERFRLFAPEELWGKTIGIVGYGSIGRQVARLAESFGMRVLAMQRGSDHRDAGFVFPGVGDPDGMLPSRYYPPEQLRDLLAESDVVVVALPLTSLTYRLFDGAVFQSMKPGAFFVNVARGDLCDEDALVHALQHGPLAGAALDVYAHEPVAPDSPLWQLPNVILSPHVSGFTPQYDARALSIFEQNLRRYASGEPLMNRVDKVRGY